VAIWNAPGRPCQHGAIRAVINLFTIRSENLPLLVIMSPWDRYASPGWPHFVSPWCQSGGGGV